MTAASPTIGGSIDPADLDAVLVRVGLPPSKTRPSAGEESGEQQSVTPSPSASSLTLVKPAVVATLKDPMTTNNVTPVTSPSSSARPPPAGHPAMSPIRSRVGRAVCRLELRENYDDDDDDDRGGRHRASVEDVVDAVRKVAEISGYRCVVLEEADGDDDDNASCDDIPVRKSRSTEREASVSAEKDSLLGSEIRALIVPPIDGDAATPEKSAARGDDKSGDGSSSMGTSNPSASSSSSSSSSSLSSSSSSSASASASSTTLLSESSDESESILSDDSSSLSPSNSEVSLAALERRSKRKFDLRQKELKRIVRGRSAGIYARIMEGNERSVRERAMLALKTKREEKEKRQAEDLADASSSQKRDPTMAQDADESASREKEAAVAKEPDARSDGDNENILRAPADRVTFLCRLRTLLLLDCHHALPGYTAMLLYCLAHFSIYEVLNQTLMESTGDDYQYLVYTSVLIVGLGASRLTGAVYGWVDEPTHAAARFDLHNRLRLGTWDARSVRWFKRHPRTRCAVDTVALYLCFIAVGFGLHYGALPAAIDQRAAIVEGLPSLKYDGVYSRVKETLTGEDVTYAEAFGFNSTRARAGAESRALTDSDSEAAGLYCFDADGEPDKRGEECYNLHQMADELTYEDEVYLWDKLSVSSFYYLMGDENATLVRPLHLIAFFAANAIISVALLFRLGFSFSDLV